MIQGGVASSTERGSASLTTVRLDLLGLAMLAIPNQRMPGSVCDPGVRTLRVGTSEALGVDPSGGFLGGFSPQARDATSAGTGPPPDEAMEARRQAGQWCGQRGESRRWSLVRILAAALDWAEPGWGQQRDPSRSRQSMRKDTSRNKNI